MRVIIAEKPSMAREIAKYLPGSEEKANGYIQRGDTCVTWCFGHLFEQAPPDAYLPSPTPDMLGKNGKRRWSRSELPIIPKQWKLQINTQGGGGNRQQYEVIKGLVKKASEIVVAGDADREGQLLVDEVLQQAGVDPDAAHVKRFWNMALDEEGIRKSLSSLRPNAEYRNLRQSALARSRADWLIGMNLTRAYTLMASHLVSVGRVQTPTLSLIVKRDELIENFKPEDYFVPWVELPDGSVLDWAGSTEEIREGISPEGRIISKALAEKIQQDIDAGLAWEVTKAERREQAEKPPLPHSLDSLQIYMNRKHRMSAKQTLDACQSLYETHKLTTYPRSDCQYLPETMYAEREKVLKGIAGNYVKEIQDADFDRKSACWNDSKVSAHHAIIPTGKTPHGGLSQEERQVFDVVSRFYIAQFYEDALFQKSELEILFGKLDRFRASEKALLKPGWKVVLGHDKPESEESVERKPKMQQQRQKIEKPGLSKE